MADTAPATTCRHVAIPVQLNGLTGPIAGTLCTPPGATVVQLLVHGWTYGEYYWDIGYQPDNYSYVRKANQRGYATLAIDRLGAGSSWHPPSLIDTFEADVSSVHQVIQSLRAGNLGTRFDKVVEVGHSFGSFITMSESGEYHDVDAIVTTGAVHAINFVNALGPIALSNYPATLDPKFAADGLDPLYVTSDPGSRSSYYNTDNADPQVIALDDRLKQTGTLVAMATLPANAELMNDDSGLNVPVLVAIGERDPFFCGLGTVSCTSSESIGDFERQFYGPHATVVGYVAPGAGHDLQLEKNAAQTDRRMLDFVDQYVGHGGGLTDTEPGGAPFSPPPATPTLNPVQTLVNQTFLSLVSPLVREFGEVTKVVPGLGTNTDPAGDISPILARIATLDYQLLGGFKNSLLQ